MRLALGLAFASGLASDLAVGVAVGSERARGGEAAQLPLVALAGLSALYAAFQFVSAAVLNVALRSYAAAVGVAAVGELLRPLVPARLRAAARAGPQVRLALPLLGRVRLTALDAALYAAGAAAGAAYLRTGHWAASNALGAAFAVQGVARLSVGKYTTAAALCGGLLVYDLLMVFYTPMMIDVATKVDAPIKLLFPTGEPDKFGRPGFSLLGLGDLVIPGLLLALLLRADATHALRGPAAAADAAATPAAAAPKALAGGAAGAAVAAVGDDDDDADDARAQALVFTAFPKPLFMATWLAYAAGLIATIVVMHVFHHGPPALVYLVPATLVASAAAACAAPGGWAALLAFDDEHFAQAVAPEEPELAAGERKKEQ